MAKLIMTIGLCLLAGMACASGPTCGFSIGDNYPADDDPPNLHFSISVSEDQPDTWGDYGVIIYSKSPWRLHRSGDQWTPQKLAGGKVFLLPDSATAFYNVTLPCWQCEGEGNPPEYPPQPTPWTHEVDMRVQFQDYPWSDGTLTAEVWRWYPPPNPIVPGHYSLCYRNTIKVAPGHMHYVHQDIVREATGWVPNGVIEGLRTLGFIYMIDKYGVELVTERAGGGAVCKALELSGLCKTLRSTG